MGGPVLALACLLSLALALLSWLPDRDPGVSSVALALLPWLALAGLPRSSRAQQGAAARPAGRWLVEVAASLPILALAAATDRSAGAGAAEWPRTLIAGLVLALASSLAAERARGTTLHALLWLALVPGAALLPAALTFGAAPGGWRALGAASPLWWAWEQAGPGSWLPWLPLAACGVLLLAAFARPDRAKAAP